MAADRDEIAPLPSLSAGVREWERYAIALRDENALLRTAIQEAERAILGDGTVEADLRLHEALTPLWQALQSGSTEGASDGR